MESGVIHCNKVEEIEADLLPHTKQALFFLLPVKADPDEIKGFFVKATADTAATCNLVSGGKGANNNIP